MGELSSSWIYHYPTLWYNLLSWCLNQLKNCSKTAAEISWISFYKYKKKLSNSLIKSSWFILGLLVDSCFCFLSIEHMSRGVTHVFEKKRRQQTMELLKIEFGFQPRSKSGVQKEVQSYHLGWHFQICCQKIVGKWFFTIFGYNKDKNITLFDTNCFEMLLLL